MLHQNILLKMNECDILFIVQQNDDEDGASTKGGGNPALVSIPNPLYSGYRAFAEPFGVNIENPMNCSQLFYFFIGQTCL